MDIQSIQGTLSADSNTDENRAALKALYEGLKSKAIALDADLKDLLNSILLNDRENAALAGLILWESIGRERPVPFFIKARVLPMMFEYEESDLGEVLKEVLENGTMSSFFEESSQRALLDEAQDEFEDWYLYKFLGTATADACLALDKRLGLGL